MLHDSRSSTGKIANGPEQRGEKLKSGIGKGCQMLSSNPSCGGVFTRPWDVMGFSSDFQMCLPFFSRLLRLPWRIPLCLSRARGHKSAEPDGSFTHGAPSPPHRLVQGMLRNPWDLRIPWKRRDHYQTALLKRLLDAFMLSMFALFNMSHICFRQNSVANWSPYESLVLIQGCFRRPLQKCSCSECADRSHL